MRHCERLPGGGFVCGPGRTATICDVCDRKVNAHASKRTWRGVEVDMCGGCTERYYRRPEDPEFRAWADKVIEKHYPGVTASPGTQP